MSSDGEYDYAAEEAELASYKSKIARLTAEVERLVKSRNRWGQKYNKLLSAVRTENAYGVYAEARDTYREKITELAAENEKLRNDVRLAVMSDSKECTAISEVNVRLTAEVERLRAALAAIEKLALQASIASCTCLTKTPDITFHNPGCRYVLLQYIVAQCEDARAALKEPRT